MSHWSGAKLQRGNFPGTEKWGAICSTPESSKSQGSSGDYSITFLSQKKRGSEKLEAATFGRASFKDGDV